MDTTKITELFRQELRIINMGLVTFADNLKGQDMEVVQMEWQPPAGGNERLIALLEKLGR
jgi:hypothetical protein